MGNLQSKEHYDLIATFERTMKKFIGRTDKEPKELWSSGQIYQDGATNDIFIAFRSGYSLGKAEGCE